MTLEEIRRSEKAFLTCKDISLAMGSDQHTLHLLAMDEKQRGLLGFPVTIIGNRVKIPRIPFLQYLGVMDNAALDV